MMRILVLCFIIYSSCIASLKDKSSACVEVSIKVLKHNPYFGGAKPNEMQVKGTSTLFKNQDFIIKNENNLIFGRFTHITDSEAKFCLKEGDYQIFISDKEEPFEDFVLLYGIESEYLKSKGIDCFKKWYLEADATFSVSKNSSNIELTVQSYCDTDINPCLRYTGPKRPARN